ncbi:hypothetical protein Q9R08_17360 [Microbacterium sp. QXD-8]|uniref:DUF624 domain-containing protein n=1 Tax=Microbacterium psychrotolerans TaxID=3068321 RepID=A0ABU0Z7M4_9MICO|nr:hypothetical protein [Microbacterium sp. QXD-8]MDQ7879764.1 hypothetical protein [Microbacterium sp. QXD-8]
MTAQAPSKPVSALGRLRGLAALEGPLATTVLTVFQYFLVSVSFWGCLVPAFAFLALVGWQPTHVALWLGALSLLPVVPAVYALLRSSRRLLAERGTARAGRVFWTSFAQACRTLAWAALSVGVLALLLAYDLALFGASDAMLLFAVGVAVVVLVLVIGICAATARRSEHRPIDVTTAAVKAIARRPHVALSWLLLVALGIGAMTLPVIGSALAMFLPALLAVGIHICNDALRLPLNDETRKTP